MPTDSCLYSRLLEDDWPPLPQSVKTLHCRSARLTATGRATVERGTGLLARFIGGVFRFPIAAADVEVTVQFDLDEIAERWTRTFGTRSFSSTQYAGKGRYRSLLCERFGPFVFGMSLLPDAGRLRLIVRRWSVFGIPLPSSLAPRGDSYEFDDNGTFNFHVEIRAPLAGLIVRYVGFLVPVADAPGNIHAEDKVDA